MLIRSGLLFLLTLIFSQGCATTTPIKPVSADAQNVQPAVTESGTSKLAVSAPSAGAASRVYRDPVTGAYTEPPPDVTVPSAPGAIRESVSTKPPLDLQETSIEGGGTLIHLQGRFRSYLSATKNSEGKISVHCIDKPNSEVHHDKASEK